ncbi:MAG: gamma carbonic anhydrase family protein [SAR202 cluster bacterium]|nr:gamma carbonic anhydrase family protein [SAR202 cluster bacterium]|tara:strand:+ start:29885 stop:30391 length:507 start_codon:yes stop_codon:yes gene_type:complete
MLRSLDGKMPKVHDTAFVSEFAYVIGDVEIGPGSSIWPGTVIRADMGTIKIGKFTCIQDNSVVHGDSDVFIGDNVVLGHRVLCHAAIIESRCLIGNGAVLNDGVKIGTESLIGSSSMLLENSEIPAGSLVVGSPGRVRGNIQERHLDLIDSTAESYVVKARKYLENGL